MAPFDSREPYVFVSYASANRPCVFGIAAILETQGIPLWLDRRSITGGSRWTTEIVRGVEDCAVLLVMCSPASVSSRNVQQEVQLAWESNRPILPVIVEEVQLPAEIRYALAGQQWVEVRDRPEGEWLPELLEALESLGVRGPTSDQPPVPGVDTAPSGPGPAVSTLTGAQEPEPKRLHNLTAPRASFVGRTAQLGEVQRALQEHRVVTLTGPGGVGKSRVGLELGWRVLPDYPDGVWLVPLDTASDPALIPQLVADATGVRDVPGRPLIRQLINKLASRSALLILDNCERLLGSCAELSSSLVGGGRGLRILATSREMLGMTGEWVISIPPMDVPPPRTGISLSDLHSNESVQLFVDRATGVSQGFELNSRNAAAVADVCRLLDGIPLAIELAAARVRTLAPEQLRSRLGDLFGLLRGMDRTVLPRQRTLQATVDWSYDALRENERVLWRRLSVFAEGFNLGAAEQVSGFDPVPKFEVLDLLTSLVDKSLVMTVRGGVEVRYRLLKTLKQYAEARLHESGEEAAIRDRHVVWCQDIATSAEAALVKEEYPNLRAAMEYLISAGRGREALEMIMPGDFPILMSNVIDLLWQRYPSDGRRITESALAKMPPERTVTRGKGLLALGYWAMMNREFEEAGEFLSKALDIGREAGEHGLVVGSMSQLGGVVALAGRSEEGVRLVKEALDYSLAHGVQWPVLDKTLGGVYHLAGDDAAARAAYGEFLASDESSAYRPFVELQLGWIALCEGDVEEARRFAEVGLAEARAFGVHAYIHYGLSLYGSVLVLSGKARDAVPTLKKALRMAHEEGEMLFGRMALYGLAYAALLLDQMQRAATLVGVVERFPGAFPKLLSELYERARDVIQPGPYESSRARGRAMDLDQAVAYALEEPEPGERQY